MRVCFDVGWELWDSIGGPAWSSSKDTIVPCIQYVLSLPHERGTMGWIGFIAHNT